MNKFKNPIIEGFSPDPSVCAVGEDFYLVTSSFGYFPGVPIYHSKDMVNWQQIGNVLDRESQLNLDDAGSSRGIFAPTIRYHDGIFYMITTNVTYGGNFVVTATDPAGPWSEPYYLEGAIGIDPSLFFDEDGRCYYCGTRPNPTGVTHNGDWEVWLQELDLNTMQLTGVSTKIWKGAMRNVIWPEAPHIYRKDDYYYVMIAEGGTGPNHSVTIARSEKIDGPYIGFANNPILTHRHLGSAFPVQNVGHGDLVETPDGQWFMVLLASRKFEGSSNLGRETFLAEVIWEDGWPVVNPGIGRLLEEQEIKLPLVPVEEKTDYHLNDIHREFLFIRNPDMSHYDTDAREGWIRMTPTAGRFKDEKGSPTYIGLRQPSLWFEYTAALDIQLTDGGEAGIAVIQGENHTLKLAVHAKDSEKVVQVITTIDGEEKVHGETTVTASELELKFIGEGQKVKGVVLADGKEVVVAENVATHYLSTELAGGFVGCTVGIYTSSDVEAPGYVDANWIKLEKTNQ
ncbi:glycoside hydrolase family 43 protein [Jeotgalibaca ciconiae]|uniref:Glycoside hydrolase family 43 protein n=1 Tax=Jeotgalibaca ciconiae TaxID=2496265 RepID=A0A3Q9BK73_9LACT|nr:glycoside hydrolase family 43 protein [Jeotgalibaca ciconiae]AZP04169.1 glycoside hydrolase family 43 protein [Jeotgalibaca ciconiae]HJB22800.1 glycoside hydrolase family 43 protein [Candidatus Jeotgalibaca pullicola]